MTKLSGQVLKNLAMKKLGIAKAIPFDSVRKDGWHITKDNGGDSLLEHMVEYGEVWDQSLLYSTNIGTRHFYWLMIPVEEGLFIQYVMKNHELDEERLIKEAGFEHYYLLQ